MQTVIQPSHIAQKDYAELVIFVHIFLNGLVSIQEKGLNTSNGGEKSILKKINSNGFENANETREVSNIFVGDMDCRVRHTNSD